MLDVSVLCGQPAGGNDAFRGLFSPEEMSALSASGNTNVYLLPDANSHAANASSPVSSLRVAVVQCRVS